MIQENQDGAPTANGEGEGQSVVAESQTAAELEALKKELSKRDETIGSLKREMKDLKKSVEPKDTPQETTQQSNEPDYARLAYLKANQVDHPDDQKVILDEAARLKLPLTEVLQMEHIKTRLTSQRDQRATQAGMPDGTGRKGEPGRSDVDYYLAHPDEVPTDPELHVKVINERMRKEENAGKFSSVPFTG